MRFAGKSIAGLIIAATLTALPLMAQPGWYVKGGFGPAWTEDVDVEEFLGPISGVEAKMDLGIRFDIGGGYRFTDWFSLEAETGVIHNYIDEISTPGGSADDLDDSSIANVPFLVNAVFDIPTGTALTPFAGVGAGFSFTVLTLDDVGNVDGDDSDAVFAYQAFGGVRYHISEQWSVSIAYKYFGTTDPSWEVHGAPGDIDIEVDGAKTHAVVASFGFSF